VLGISNLARTYFAVRPEDKLPDLLQRDVDQDPDALIQIAESRQANDRSKSPGAGV
jgi:hypothetical protein